MANFVFCVFSVDNLHILTCCKNGLKKTHIFNMNMYLDKSAKDNDCAYCIINIAGGDFERETTRLPALLFFLFSQALINLRPIIDHFCFLNPIKF